jgi:hypothetical protein
VQEISVSPEYLLERVSSIASLIEIISNALLPFAPLEGINESAKPLGILLLYLTLSIVNPELSPFNFTLLRSKCPLVAGSNKFSPFPFL